MKKYILSILVLCFGQVCLAERDVFVFVSSDPTSKQILHSDPFESAQAFQYLNAITYHAHLATPQEQQPGLLNLQLKDLKEFEANIKKYLQPGDAIKAIVLSGHGNEQAIALNAEAKYSGRQVGEIFGSPTLKSFLAPDFTIYFGACNCGRTLEPSGFQIQFMETFKTQNDRIPPKQKTRTLVSLAHHFGSSGASNFEGSKLTTMLYSKGLLSAVNNLDTVIFKYLGHTAMFSSHIIVGAVAAGLFGLFTYAGPESIEYSTRVLSMVLTVPVMGLHRFLKVQSSYVTRRLEYKSSSRSDFLESTVLARDGMQELVGANRCALVF